MATPIDDDATTASIDPAHEDDINVSKAPAVVSWTGDQDQVQILKHSPLTHDHVTFDILFDGESHTAFFKITANVSLRGKRSRSNVFLFVPPERILSLNVVEQHDASVSAAKTLGTNTCALHFVLVKPPALVVPKEDHVPKGENAQSTLESLQALARKTNFWVHFPSRALSTERLLALCEKASTSGVLKTMPGVANIAKLYGGKGGRTFECGQAEINQVQPGEKPSGSAASAAKAPSITSPNDRSADPKNPTSGAATCAEVPPSYDNLGRSPPSYPPRGKKRRLDPSPEDASQSLLKMVDICRQGFGEIGRRLDRIEKQISDMGSRLDRAEQHMESIEGATGKAPQPRSSEHGGHGGEGLEQRVVCVEERVSGLEAKLEAGLSELAENVDNQIAEATYDFDHNTLVRIEDEMGVAQTQLEEFVRDELRNVADEMDDAIREKLRDALA